MLYRKHKFAQVLPPATVMIVNPCTQPMQNCIPHRLVQQVCDVCEFFLLYDS